MRKGFKAGLFVFYLFFSLLVQFSITSGKAAQVGSDSEIWNWTPKGDHHHSIVKVLGKSGEGTGVVVFMDKSKPVANGYFGLVLTANHVTQEANVVTSGTKITQTMDDSHKIFRVAFKDDQKSKDCKIVVQDFENDIAILWAWIPNDIEPATISSSNIEKGNFLEFAGFGGGSKVLRHFKGYSAITTVEQTIFSDTALIPGDSGGPVFNEKKEVVGIISGGWLWWFHKNIKNQDGKDIPLTWPARAANQMPIRKLLNEAIKKQFGELENK